MEFQVKISPYFVIVLFLKNVGKVFFELHRVNINILSSGSTELLISTLCDYAHPVLIYSFCDYVMLEKPWFVKICVIHVVPSYFEKWCWHPTTTSTTVQRLCQMFLWYLCNFWFTRTVLFEFRIRSEIRPPYSTLRWWK